MYLGRIVEIAPAEQLFTRPLHPYTRGLLASVLRADLEARAQLEAVERIAPGDVPSLLNPPRGCRYHPRCPYATQRCQDESPSLEKVEIKNSQDHAVSCHYWRDIQNVSGS
jgi:oligopeptide/dipeptide ABC transporter ATP-binding protein